MLPSRVILNLIQDLSLCKRPAVGGFALKWILNQVQDDAGG